MYGCVGVCRAMYGYVGHCIVWVCRASWGRVGVCRYM